jgi:hypothetical protein
MGILMAEEVRIELDKELKFKRIAVDGVELPFKSCDVTIYANGTGEVRIKVGRVIFNYD